MASFQRKLSLLFYMMVEKSKKVGQAESFVPKAELCTGDNVVLYELIKPVSY